VRFGPATVGPASDSITQTLLLPGQRLLDDVFLLLQMGAEVVQQGPRLFGGVFAYPGDFPAQLSSRLRALPPETQLHVVPGEQAFDLVLVELGALGGGEGVRGELGELGAAGDGFLGGGCGTT
jgi:hypothetical protein